MQCSVSANLLAATSLWPLQAYGHRLEQHRLQAAHMGETRSYGRSITQVERGGEDEDVVATENEMSGGERLDKILGKLPGDSGGRTHRTHVS